MKTALITGVTGINHHSYCEYRALIVTCTSAHSLSLCYSKLIGMSSKNF